jgi:hypothetical protein
MQPVLIRCSLTYITSGDIRIIKTLVVDKNAQGWIHSVIFGYILDLTKFTHPLLTLKRQGFSRNLRRFIYLSQRKYNAQYIHLDFDSDILDNIECFA